MDQLSPPQPRRALIVEDEIVIALDLQDAMSGLGFEISDLAPNPNRAFSLAMSHHPDIVLMDVLSRWRPRRHRGWEVAKRGLRSACCLCQGLQ
jgi:CheY-like chemotaxis protein